MTAMFQDFLFHQWLQPNISLSGHKHICDITFNINGTPCSAFQFYRHRDYGYTFRSKKEVVHFLDTGEAKRNGIMEKVPMAICIINLFYHFLDKYIYISFVL